MSVTDLNTDLVIDGIVFGEVLAELETARANFAPMNSAHEGWAVLREEVDELWDEVKTKPDTPGRTARMRAEAIQVAAMAIRFVLDVCDPQQAADDDKSFVCPKCKGFRGMAECETCPQVCGLCGGDGETSTPGACGKCGLCDGSGRDGGE